MCAYNLFPVSSGEIVKLRSSEGVPEQVHVFDEESIVAVNTALAAQRPLLVRGEPGTGKTQLARAVAKKLKRAFLPYVVDARTEPRDLLWRFDAVARLAEAQLQSNLHHNEEKMREDLKIARFVDPGPLWWAFDWESAENQAPDEVPNQLDGGSPENGCVVLIDEIDKAESDVPNALLQALGDCCFRPEGFDRLITSTGKAPLVFITTNEERSLPDAFVRRCCVLWLRLPTQEQKFIKFLSERGQAHFGTDATDSKKDIFQEAAKLVWKQRQAIAEGRPRPGQAEFMDLVRAVLNLRPESGSPNDVLDRVSRFLLKKHHEES